MFVYGSSEKCAPHEQYVCTRAEFEAYVKEQEDKQEYPPLTQSLIKEAEQETEKWTHEYHGDNCKIVHQEKWQAWIVSEKGLSKLVPISELRKPKPALTKEQAWVKMQSLIPKYGVTSAYIIVKRDYDII